MRTLMISGASRGIGRAIARKALADGHRLSLGLRDLNSLKGSVLDPEVAGKHRVMLHSYSAEDSLGAQSWVDATVDYFGSFDSLICSAGIFSRVSVLFSPGEEEEIERTMKINLIAPWILARAAWPQLVHHGSGRIQMLVSLSGKESKGKLAAYSASKFALLGLCQTMRNEGWNDGIRVTAICPGWVNTDMAHSVLAEPSEFWPTHSLKPEEMTQPEDIADISSALLKLDNRAVPFEVSVNSNLGW
ncbi:short-chain dehydrogenase/reductase family [Synechococcus sp. BIOS-E4-1]|nr:short-chain dehydrogenase/reductase family [Synechococcus sp. BIOS-E4-1]